jgi:Trk K+ transport system NAD-binding subunit
MVQIGATEVFAPSHVLGAALASRASTRISPPAEGMHLLGAQVGMAEFRVHTGSPLAGKRLGELHLREQHGVSVIGQWYGGVFTTTKGPDTRVQPGCILVVVGIHANLEKVERMAMPIRRAGPIVVAGFGAVGQKVIELLHDAGETCTVMTVWRPPVWMWWATCWSGPVWTKPGCVKPARWCWPSVMTVNPSLPPLWCVTTHPKCR